MTTSTPPPLLNYVLSTQPAPLQVSTSGTLTVVATNPPPGTYAPAGAAYPNNGYVGVSKLLFDFGPAGTGGSSLCPGDAGAWTVTPPAGWSAPSINGLQLTFTAPGTGVVAPSGSLSFSFADIPVNATVGSVTLTITETAYTPGDPENPTDFPAYPSPQTPPLPPAVPVYQTAWAQTLIGKFLQGFAPSFVATPVNVPAGGSTTFSWTGLPAGVNPSLSYGSTVITQHANGSLLQPTDSYPDTTLAPPDPPFALEDATIFTLSGDYTPTGTGSPVPFELQLTVGVYYPAPSIQSFTLEPQVQLVGATGGVTFTWSTSNGVDNGPVSFTATPPLTAAEIALNGDNDLFNTDHTAAGSACYNFLVGHQITLAVSGQIGTTPATQTCGVTVADITNLTSGIGNAIDVAVTPDGAYAFVLCESGTGGSGSIAVVDTTATEPSQWSVVATLPVTGGVCTVLAVASSANGTFLLAPVYTGNPANQLSVVTVTSAPPAQWPVANVAIDPYSTTNSSGQFVILIPSDIAVSPDGLHVFITAANMNNFGTYLSILTIDGSDPTEWPAVNINAESESLSWQGVTVSPSGDYAFVLESNADTDGMGRVRVLGLSAPQPSKWTFVASIDLAAPLAVDFPPASAWITLSPNGTIGLVADATSSSVQVLDLSATDPADWSVTASLTSGFFGMTGLAFSADGSFALVTGGLNNYVASISVSSIVPPADWPVVQLTEGIGSNPSAIAAAATGDLAFVACSGSLTALSLSPAPAVSA